jgi:hypothetical protein
MGQGQQIYVTRPAHMPSTIGLPNGIRATEIFLQFELQSFAKQLKLAEPNGGLAPYKLCTRTVKCSVPK